VGVDCADLACVMSDCSADVPYASPADLDLSQKQLALRTSARPTSWMLVRLERRVDNDIGVSDVDDVWNAPTRWTESRRRTGDVENDKDADGYDDDLDEIHNRVGVMANHLRTLSRL